MLTDLLTAVINRPRLHGRRWRLRARCYRSGSADAARSRASDPAATRAEPTAILGQRRCTARAARRTPYTAFGASTAIASTVSRRGWRRRHGTLRTIHATGETRPYRRKNRDTRRAAGVSVPAVAGACVPRLRIRSLSCRWMFSSTSAGVGASVPRPHATSPKPAAPAHSARARCRRPAAQCPAPAAAWTTTGATRFTHPRVVEGLAPSRSIKATRCNWALLSPRAIPSLSPWRRGVPIRAARPTMLVSARSPATSAGSPRRRCRGRAGSCPLRARWDGRSGTVTVTRGQTGKPADLDRST